MADQDNKQKVVLLTSFMGTVEAANVEMKTGKGDKQYMEAKMDVPGKDAQITLYVHGEDRVKKMQEKINAGGAIFVQGEALARGAGLGVTLLEPKKYEGEIVALHKTGTNEIGDWAAARLKLDGMEKERNVMLTGDDAKAAIEAGAGGKIAFAGAWRASKNEENGKWYSQLVSASSLERAPVAEKDPEPGM